MAQQEEEEREGEQRTPGDADGHANSQRGTEDAPTVALDSASVRHADTLGMGLGSSPSDKLRRSGDSVGYGHTDEGMDFWARQSTLWSGVFAEQQAGLLQMVKAQEAELRQGKQRIGLLEQQLSVLNDKRAELGACYCSAFVQQRRS